ncbi:MAG: carboxypeptidase regulatory-like domain-containing protein [Acidobacteriota bacterium]
MVGLLGWCVPQLLSQMNGAGSIAGTVVDPAGAYVPGATVTALNVATGVKTIRKTTSSGYYVLSPLDPGTYSVRVTAQGFESLTQDNVVVDALQVVGLNLKVHVGEVSQNVTVTAAPPSLDTASATLGGTVENQSYTALPLQMNGGARNATQFVYLMPGVSQGNSGSSGVYNGVGSVGRNDELYIDGIPTTRISLQGDPRNVSNSIAVEAVDQFQVVTSDTPVEYAGIGAQNYVIKSGTNQLHGSLYEYLRNTALDTWGWGAPAVLNPATGKATKPVEHQNEFGLAAGGPVLRNRIFFFGNYDGFAYSKDANPSLITVPTMRERGGDFTDLPSKQPIYDPSTTSCNSSGQCARSQFDYNNVPNTMDPAEIMPMAKALMDGFPEPSNPNALTNNYLGPNYSSSFAWKALGKVDANITSSQRIAVVFSASKSYPHGYTIKNNIPLPLPWVNGQIAIPYTKNTILEHTYVITDHLINQLKFAFLRYNDAIGNANYNPIYGASAKYGIAGLPTGQTANTFPEIKFSSPNGIATWNDGGKAYQEVTNTYDLVDNVQYVRGKHSFVFGVLRQWLQDNFTSYTTGNSPLNLNYSNKETAGFSAISGSKGGTLNSSSGDSFASFLLDQVDSASFTQSSIITSYGRMHTLSLYAQDDYRLSPSLSLNLGIRWDWFPPYYEGQNRMSWLNPNLTNPAVDYPGALQFAGSGAAGCNCKTPINDWKKNFAPRIGAAYSLNTKTVVRAGFSINYGRDTGSNNIGRSGSGNQGFSASPKAVSPSSGIAAFVLDDGFPSYEAPPFIDPAYGAGYASNISAGAQGVTYADPYYGSRNPYAVNWNIGIERELLDNITASINYVGSQGHFLAPSSGGARGFWSDQLDPKYYNLGNLLNASATSSNIAAAQAIDPDIKLPYATFGGKGATIAQMLRPFPQYTGVSDAFGDVANSNYNAMQMTIKKRMSQGIEFMLNYTYSHEIDDQGTYRSGYLPTSVERSRGAQDTPQIVSGTAVWNLPFGRGHSLGNGSLVTRALTSGWEASSIYTYSAGYPLLITASACQEPDGGTCMPNYEAGFSGQVRQNGSWGHGALAGLNSPSYIKGSGVAFADPAPYTIGNLARTGAYGLRGPGTYDIDMSVKRTFTIREGVSLLFDVSGYNLTNKVLFAIASTNIDNANFGQVSGQSNNSRDIQLAARINF